jgi:hypothetical protein
MQGETDLHTLFKSLKMRLAPEVFVFVTLPQDQIPAGLSPQMIFQETEGTTLILTEESAKAHDLPYTFRSRMITLNVHSALDAVGFIARIATALAAHDMGANPVAGYFHDHLFVPVEKADHAMKVLSDMAARAQ